jgi:hypothetical protein
MARHGLLMLLEVLLLGLVLFWCAPAQQKAAHKQRVPEGLSLSSIFILSFHRLCLLFAPLLLRARPTQGGPQAAGPGRFVSFLHLYSFLSQALFTFCFSSGAPAQHKAAHKQRVP